MSNPTLFFPISRQRYCVLNQPPRGIGNRSAIGKVPERQPGFSHINALRRVEQNIAVRRCVFKMNAPEMNMVVLDRRAGCFPEQIVRRQQVKRRRHSAGRFPRQAFDRLFKNFFMNLSSEMDRRKPQTDFHCSLDCPHPFRQKRSDIFLQAVFIDGLQLLQQHDRVPFQK